MEHDIEDALRDARISMRMWGMGTPKIDALLGPLTADERDKAERARGGPLPFDGEPYVEKGPDHAETRTP